jgi:hypothetical protein
VEDQGLTADEGHGDRAVIGGGGGDRAHRHGDEDRHGGREYGEQAAAFHHGRASLTITWVKTPLK